MLEELLEVVTIVLDAVIFELYLFFVHSVELDDFLRDGLQIKDDGDQGSHTVMFQRHFFLGCITGRLILWGIARHNIKFFILKELA